MSFDLPTQSKCERVFGPQASHHPGPIIMSKDNIDNALRNIYKTNLKNEIRIKDLESRLSDDFSNFRAIDNLLQDVHNGLQRSQKRAERSLTQQVPRINEELIDSMDTLTDLAETLPKTQTLVSDIREVYDSGRLKARQLVSDLIWLNTEFYERWRIIIFTPSSPVSTRWKIYMRTLFVVSFIICSSLFWIAVSGAYRAHRHRLVWGEKLMS